jgi:hypothetical protein
MTAKPPIPPEQRAFKGQRPEIEGDAPKKAHDTRKGQDANIRQNLTPQRSVQDR